MTSGDGIERLLAGYKPDPGVFDELMDKDGRVRAHWQPFLSMLSDLGPEEIGRRFAAAQRPALSRDVDKFLSELGWREFCHHLLFHFPTLPQENWRRAFDAYPWRDSADDLAAWQRGRTGYPLVDAGMRVQIGHTLGTYDEGVQALDRGAKGFTHLFNAMSRFDHRAPGMVGAALAHAEYSEIIPDLLHVHPGAIKAALRSIPHLYCVTDSTSASGMPDGQYMLGRQIVHKCLGGVRLEDGTLAGSTLTMDQALRNLVSIGLSLEEASHRVSTYAADYLGLSERGRLQAEAFADLVVLDEALNLIAVYVEGEKIDLANA